MELIIIRNMIKAFRKYLFVASIFTTAMSWVGIVANKYCDKFSCKSN